MKSEKKIKKKNDRLEEKAEREHTLLGLRQASDYKENKIFTVLSSGVYRTLQCMNIYKVKQRLT